MIDSSFINNSAVSGGAIECQNCRIDITSSRFIANIAESHGGAIALTNWDWKTTATTLMGKVGFYNNVCFHNNSKFLIE